jgi:hypothetical protein
MKFEELVHLVGFITRKFVTMYVHMNLQKQWRRYVFHKRGAFLGYSIIRCSKTTKLFDDITERTYKCVASAPYFVFITITGDLLDLVQERKFISKAKVTKFKAVPNDAV